MCVFGFRAPLTLLVARCPPRPDRAEVPPGGGRASSLLCRNELATIIAQDRTERGRTLSVTNMSGQSLAVRGSGIITQAIQGNPVTREEQTALVAEYISRGGSVRRIPPPNAMIAADVLTYLRTWNIEVQTRTDEEGKVTGYIYKGEVVSLKTLVTLANDHRMKRHLPRFHFDG
jgi:hypothetical protein